MKRFKAVAGRTFYCIAGVFIGLLVVVFLNCESVASATTALATSIVALASIAGVYVASTQLNRLSQTRSEQFIESMNRRFDSQEMRKKRGNIYKKYKPDQETITRIDEYNIDKKYESPTEPIAKKEFVEEDRNMMERVWNYLDAVGFLMLENEQLKEKGLKLWSYNFCRCWLCMEPYIVQSRNDRGNKDFLMFFQDLFDESRKYLKKKRHIELKQLRWFDC